MFDFVRVEGGAPYFPHTCRFCQSGKDLLDTSAEDHVGRLYVCRLCIERGARVFGMIEGNRHQELMQADTSLRRAEKALVEKDEQVTALVGQLETLDRVHAAALSELEIARQRITQLEDATRARAAEELALVGGTARVPIVGEWESHPSTTASEWDVKHTYPNPHAEREEHHGKQEDQRDRSRENDPED